MPSPSATALFAVAALALLVIPGPSVMYIVTRSVDEGRRAGLASVLGVHLGTMVHITAAAVGLSALVASSATAFTILKLGGATYLVVIGVRRILSHQEDRIPTAAARASLRRIVLQGAVINVLNPKTALFFLAFLPQFVDPHARVATQVLVLGAVFIGLGLVSDGTYALAGAAAGGWLRRHLLDGRRQRIVTGGIYVTLGAAAALSGSARHG